MLNVAEQSDGDHAVLVHGLQGIVGLPDTRQAQDANGQQQR